MRKCRYVDKDWRQRVDPFLEEILSEFEANLAKDTASLKELLEIGDLERVERIAHSYKGSAGYFDLQKLTSVACSLEVQCKAGDKQLAESSIEAWRALIEELEIGKPQRN